MFDSLLSDEIHFLNLNVHGRTNLGGGRGQIVAGGTMAQIFFANAHADVITWTREPSMDTETGVSTETSMA